MALQRRIDHGSGYLLPISMLLLLDTEGLYGSLVICWALLLSAGYAGYYCLAIQRYAADNTIYRPFSADKPHIWCVSAANMTVFHLTVDAVSASHEICAFSRHSLVVSGPWAVVELGQRGCGLALQRLS